MEHLQDERYIEYLEGVPEGRALEDVERHLETCLECREKLDEMRRLETRLDSLRAPWQAQNIPEGLNTRVRDALATSPARQLRIRWGHFGLAAAIVLIVAIVLIIVNLEPSDTAPRFVLDMGDLEEGLTPGRGGALSPSPSALIVKTSPITVKGRISPETMISLNGNRLELDQDGNFQTPVSLVLGENRLIFMIITTNGEEETLERVVIFEP